MSEAISLPVSAVDSKQMLLHIIGKGNKERLVPLTEPVLQMLREVWKTHRNRKSLFPRRKTCRLTGVELLRRLLMHVLPKGFHKARYYGLWHSSKRPPQERARLLLALETPAQTVMPMSVANLGAEAQHAGDDRYIGLESSDGGFRPRCPHCGSDRVTRLAELARGPSP